MPRPCSANEALRLNVLLPAVVRGSAMSREEDQARRRLPSKSLSSTGSFFFSSSSPSISNVDENIEHNLLNFLYMGAGEEPTAIELSKSFRLLQAGVVIHPRLASSLFEYPQHRGQLCTISWCRITLTVDALSMSMLAVPVLLLLVFCCLCCVARVFLASPSCSCLNTYILCSRRTTVDFWRSPPTVDASHNITISRYSNK